MGNRLLSWKDTLLFPPPSNFFPRARFRGRIITACIFLEIIKWRKVVVAMCAREFFKFFGFCSIFFHSIVITLCNDYYGFERFSEKEWWFYSTINEHLYIQRLQKWFRNDLSLKQFYYTRDHRLNIIHPRVQILIYLVITFSTSTSSFHLTFLWMEILGSISNETREKRNGIIKRNEQKKISQFYSYAVSIQ